MEKFEEIESNIHEFSKRAFLSKILFHREKVNEYIMEYNQILCLEALKHLDLPKNIVQCKFVRRYKSILDTDDKKIIEYFQQKRKSLEQEFVHIVFEDEFKKQYILLFIKDYIKIKYEDIKLNVSPSLLQKITLLSNELLFYQNEINIKK